MVGRIVNADASLPGNVIALSSLWKAYDALGLAYNRRTGTFFMVSHDGRGLPTSVEDGGVEINANGTPVDNGFLVTADGAPGNFYPRLAASADAPDWMLVASNGFLSTINQRIQGTEVNNPQPPVSNPAMVIDTPRSGFVQQPVWLAGWGLDFGSGTGSGVDAVHVGVADGRGAPTFVGAVTPGMMSRPDVGAAFGSRFTATGWGLVINGLPGGTYTIAAYLHSTVSGTFNHSQGVRITIADPLMSIDTPSPNSTVSKNGFLVGGWALDRGATTGTGVDALHMWAWPVGGGNPIWAGVAAYGGVRPDLGAILGPQFTNCGFNQIVVLPPGQYDLAVYSHSSVTNSFSTGRLVRINVVQ